MINTLQTQGLSITNEVLMNSDRQSKLKISPQAYARLKQFGSYMYEWGEVIN